MLLRYYFLVTIVLSLKCGINSQIFWAADQTKGIGLWDLNLCDFVKIIDGTTSVRDQISITPKEEIIGASIINCFKWDTTVAFSHLSGYLKPPGTRLPVSMTLPFTQFYLGKSDYKEFLYFVGTGLASYNAKTEQLNYLGDFPVSVYTLAYYKDKLIGLINNAGIWSKTFVEINVNNTAILNPIFSFDSSYYHYASRCKLTSISYKCDSTVVYMVCSTDFNPKSYIYKVDIENQKLIKICETANGIQLNGLVSLDEFKSSRCQLSIDLDEDDSTIPGNDYQDSISCVSNQIKINDKDLWLYCNGSLDSLKVTLLFPFPDGVTEQINYTLNLPSILVSQTNTNEYYLQNIGNATVDDFKAVLNSFYYKNSKRNYTSGQRDVRVYIYSGSLSDSADAILNLIAPDLAGIDTSISVCPENKNYNLFDFLGEPKTAGGNWTYQGKNVSSFINTSLALSGFYSYIINRKNCSPDTATITLNIVKTPPLDLGNDTTLCKGSSLVLSPNVPYKDLRWQNSTKTNEIIADQAGLYYVTIFDSLGCSFSDTINISFTDQIQSRIDTSKCAGKNLILNNKIINQAGIYYDTIPGIIGCDTIVSIHVTERSNQVINQSISICSGKNYSYKNKLYLPGEIILDTLASQNGCDTFLRITLTETNNQIINKTISICSDKNYSYKNKTYLPGDIILDTLSSQISCDTFLEISLMSLPIPAPNLSADTIICKDAQTTISPDKNYKSYLWSTNQTSQNIQARSGTYILTVTDQNDCTNTISITIHEAPEIQYELEPYDPLCSNDKGRIIMKATSGGVAPIRYFLNGVESKNGVFDNLSPGSYVSEIVDAEGCSKSDTLQILPASAFNISMTDKIELEAGSSVIIKYIVLDGSIKLISFNPNQDITQEGTDGLRITAKDDLVYQIQFQDNNGCVITRTIQIIVKRNEGLYFPNIFSPNGDNINDFWEPYIGTEFQLIQCNIFDRWGELVYSSSTKASWDGKTKNEKCMPGVFVYYLELKDAKNVGKKMSGEINLVR